MSPSKKIKFKYYSLLIALFFFQIISIFFSALQDKVRHDYSPFVNFKSLSYWTWFFTWWSFWTCLLTIIWAVCRLICWNEKNYKIQLFDLTIVISNIVSGVVFTSGWILFGITKGSSWQIKLINPPHHSLVDKAIHPSLPLTVKQAWIFYNVALHIIAPFLVFYFFWKFSQVDSLEKNMSCTLLFSFLNPAVYFFYVIIRPELDKNIYPKIELNGISRCKHPFCFPADYPFPFFHRWMGTKVRLNDKHFDKYKGSLINRSLWIIATLVLSYLVFSLLTRYLIKWKIKRQKAQLSVPSVNNNDNNDFNINSEL